MLQLFRQLSIALLSVSLLVLSGCATTPPTRFYVLPALTDADTASLSSVVKPDLTVESRPIVSDRVVSAETVVKAGLTPGEKVVTDGQLRLAPGMKVQQRGEGQRGGKKKSG